jgi:Flp pilus assembly pilin Flp
VTNLATRAGCSVQGAYAAWLGGDRSDQGVSTVQYAFLMAIIALLVALLVGLLGPGVKGLFGSGHGCTSGFTAVCGSSHLTRVRPT